MLQTVWPLVTPHTYALSERDIHYWATQAERADLANFVLGFFENIQPLPFPVAMPTHERIAEIANHPEQLEVQEQRLRSLATCTYFLISVPDFTR